MAIVSIGGGHSLETRAAASYARMRVAGLPSGGINSAYRSLASQEALFYSRYRPAVHKRETGPYGDARWYKGVRYVRVSSAGMVAIPGTSSHTDGRALDLNTTSAAHGWMLSNGRAHGWIQTITAEPWHWEYIATLDRHTGDRIAALTPLKKRKKAKMLHFVVQDSGSARGLKYVILMPDGRRCDYTSGATDFPNAVAANIGNAIPADEALIRSLQNQLRASGPAVSTAAQIAAEVAKVLPESGSGATSEEIAKAVADELHNRTAE